MSTCLWQLCFLRTSLGGHLDTSEAHNGECALGSWNPGGRMWDFGWSYVTPARGVSSGAVKSSGRWSLAQQCLRPPVLEVCTPQAVLSLERPTFVSCEAASSQSQHSWVGPCHEPVLHGFYSAGGLLIQLVDHPGCAVWGLG